MKLIWLNQRQMKDSMTSGEGMCRSLATWSYWKSRIYEEAPPMAIFMMMVGKTAQEPG